MSPIAASWLSITLYPLPFIAYSSPPPLHLLQPRWCKMAAGGREEIRGAKMSASLRFLPAFSTSLCGQLRLREPRRQAVTGAGGGGRQAGPPRPTSRSEAGREAPTTSPSLGRASWGARRAAGNAQGSRLGYQSVSPASSCPDGTKAWSC